MQQISRLRGSTLAILGYFGCKSKRLKIEVSSRILDDFGAKMPDLATTYLFRVI